MGKRKKNKYAEMEANIVNYFLSFRTKNMGEIRRTLEKKNHVKAELSNSQTQSLSFTLSHTKMPTNCRKK